MTATPASATPDAARRPAHLIEPQAPSVTPAASWPPETCSLRVHPHPAADTHPRHRPVWSFSHPSPAIGGQAGDHRCGDPVTTRANRVVV
jgi:hypothetical protein